MIRNLLLTIIFLLIAGGTQRAAACICAESTILDNLRQSTVVFRGKVTGKRAVNDNDVEVTFTVDRVWKGNLSTTVLVHTGADGDVTPFVNTCTFRFRKGHRYIVFASGADKFDTNICSGTVELRDARAVAKQLGHARPAKSQ